MTLNAKNDKYGCPVCEKIAREEGLFELEDVLECFVENFTHRYPSFARVKQDKWLGRNVRV